MRFWFWLLLACTGWALPPVEVGLDLGRPNPWAVSLAVRPGSSVIRVQGGGWYTNPLNAWGSVRLFYGWECLSTRWYGVEAGIGAGYFRAQAADSMHIALNQSMESRLVYDTRWQESADVSWQMGVRLAFFHVRLGVPFYILGNHEPQLFWRMGVHWIFGK